MKCHWSWSYFSYKIIIPTWTLTLWLFNSKIFALPSLIPFMTCLITTLFAKFRQISKWCKCSSRRQISPWKILLFPRHTKTSEGSFYNPMQIPLIGMKIMQLSYKQERLLFLVSSTIFPSINSSFSVNTLSKTLAIDSFVFQSLL